MILLTVRCDRCGKEVSQNITDDRLDDDMIRQLGFNRIHANNGKGNILICNDCKKLLRDLHSKLELHKEQTLNKFFANKEEEKDDKRDKGAPTYSGIR